ncbi:MAG: toxin ParE1/3/4 [Candidatus Omnitrophota bacterium]|jgi:toxin ParE1/3/4
MRIRWTNIAANDLASIQDHIAKEDPKAAYAITQIIWSAVQCLSKYPNMGRAGRIKSTRELLISHTPYIAAYRKKEANIEILTIFHSARKWPENF